MEEELIDLFTYFTQNPDALDLGIKKKRIEEIGKEIYSDGGADAMQNMFYSVDLRIKEEIGKDLKSYRTLWNGIAEDWKY